MQFYSSGCKDVTFVQLTLQNMTVEVAGQQHSCLPLLYPASLSVLDWSWGQTCSQTQEVMEHPLSLLMTLTLPLKCPKRNFNSDYFYFQEGKRRGKEERWEESKQVLVVRGGKKVLLYQKKSVYPWRSDKGCWEGRKVIQDKLFIEGQEILKEIHHLTWFYSETL